MCVNKCSSSSNYKQSKYSSTGEWINKSWYICILKYYLAMERTTTTLLKHTTTK